jgi:UDP-2,3-diacylglucosamine hydrolase
MFTYFVSDVHLGLDVADPAGREERFVRFLREIPVMRTSAVYLLGDIWDFWYEYRDVVPKGYVEVLSALIGLMKAGVKVYFFQGNHDIWTYKYFEELGMIRLEQPYEVEIDGKRFCLGHGDGLGPGMHGYKFMRKCFHSRFLQALFSSLHPWFAFRLGNGWSKKSRLGKSISYEFKGTSEPLYKYCLSYPNPVDYFIFGHYHCHADIPVSATGALATPTTVTTEQTSTEGAPRLLLLRDWIQCSNWIEFDGTSCRYTEEPSL